MAIKELVDDNMDGARMKFLDALSRYFDAIDQWVAMTEGIDE